MAILSALMKMIQPSLEYRSGQIIATEVTPNDGLLRESPNTLNSDLGIIVICPDR